MKLPSIRRRASLPLGVDIGAESVSIVAADAVGDGFVIRECRTQAVADTTDATLDVHIARALRDLLATFTTRERRCVLAVPTHDVVLRTFRLPPRMRRAEAERAATLEADSLVDWSPNDRIVALDPLPGRVDEMLLSIARAKTVERLVAIAGAADLRPVAVDVPACVWRRAVPDADAVLDLCSERATLVIFGDPVGITHVFAPRLVDERLAAGTRAMLADARRDGIADVTRLAILGTPFRTEGVSDVLAADGYAITAPELGGTTSPAWTFAYGLASWSVAPRGLRAS